MAKSSSSTTKKKATTSEQSSDSSDSSESSAELLVESDKEADTIEEADTVGSPNRNIAPVPDDIQSQIIDHILLYGGINSTVTTTHLQQIASDEEAKIYTGPYKRGVQNVLNYWKSKRGRTRYLKKLEERRFERASSSPTVLASEDSVKPASPPPIAEKEPTQPAPYPIMTVIQDQLRKLAGGESNVITVNTERPEKHGGTVYISNVKDYKLPSGKIYSGYLMVIFDIDLRWIYEEKPFAAWFVGGRDVVVKSPAVSYSFLNDLSHEKNGRKKSKNKFIHDESFMQDLDVSREAIWKDKNRIFQHQLFRFPEQLETGVFADAMDNMEIASSLVPIALKHVKTSNTGTAVPIAVQRVNVVWPIAALEKEDRNTERTVGRDMKDDLEELLDGMVL